MEIELEKALHQLAARVNRYRLGSPRHWINVISDPRCEQEDRYQCLICDAHIGPNYEAHGIWHLKQSNLLPFT